MDLVYSQTKSGVSPGFVTPLVVPKYKETIKVSYSKIHTLCKKEQK